MWNYPDGMRESDIPGWNEWETMIDATCNYGMDLKFVDPDELKDIVQRIASLVSKDGMAGRTNHFAEISKELEKANNLINDAPIFYVECDFKGEVEAICDGNSYGWQCPKCNAEHEGEFDNGE
jgi:hypothetical protein